MWKVYIIFIYSIYCREYCSGFARYFIVETTSSMLLGVGVHEGFQSCMSENGVVFLMFTW